MFDCRRQLDKPERRLTLETMTDTLIARVEMLVRADRAPILSTTPTSAAIAELLSRNEKLEEAVREIATELTQLSTHVERTS
jgi:hypothetical protein